MRGHGVLFELDASGCATLIVDRPDKRNALDRAMLESLAEQVAHVRRHPNVRVVVVRGSGGAFSAGADIADWVDPGPELAAELSRLGADAFRALAALPVPTVAVLEGPAIGGGLELALACDIRVAATTARIGFPEARLGNLPAWGGVARLVQTAGLGAARHVLLSGELFDGVRAADLGIVSVACAPEALDARVGDTVACLMAGEPGALALLKTVLAGMETELTVESALASYTALLDSSRQRKREFLERRPPAEERGRAAGVAR